MQDIDFDELDRAVSSALGQDVPKETASKEAVVPTVKPAVSEPVIPSVAPVAAPVTAPPAPETTTEIQPVAGPLAVKRSSGRFMDVVHPSSDMRTSTPTVPAAQPTRTPVQLAPLGTTDEQPESTGQSPLESPFLTDAKVEKRPLGAFSGADRHTETEEEAKIRSLEAEDQPTAEPAALLEQVIEETEIIEPPVVTPEPVIAPEEPTISDKQATSIVPETPVSTGPTSITQQYTERPGNDPQPTGAIFDTEAYHKPLTHTAKGRHSALIIIMIIILTVVGAAAGAVVHFFVLPLL